MWQIRFGGGATSRKGVLVSQEVTLKHFLMEIKMPATRFRHSSTFRTVSTHLGMKKRKRRSSRDFTCRPPEMIKLGELPLFMFSSTGTFGVIVTGRMTNKQD